MQASENNKGQLTAISVTSGIKVGHIPNGTARNYYPGEGGSNNRLFDSKSRSTDGTLSTYSMTYEQHASVSKFEELGLSELGYKIVDVAQKLNLNYDRKSGNLAVGAYADILPSATLTLNGSQMMHYEQPSFVQTHSAPIVGFRSPTIRDFSYYPVTFYKRN